MALIRPIPSAGFTPLTKNKLYIMGDTTPTDLVSGNARIPLTDYKNVTMSFNSSDFTTLKFTPNEALTCGIQVFNKGQLVKNVTQSFPKTVGGSIDISGGDTTIFSTLNNARSGANDSTITLS